MRRPGSCRAERTSSPSHAWRCLGLRWAGSRPRPAGGSAGALAELTRLLQRARVGPHPCCATEHPWDPPQPRPRGLCAAPSRGCGVWRGPVVGAGAGEGEKWAHAAVPPSSPALLSAPRAPPPPPSRLFLFFPLSFQNPKSLPPAFYGGQARAHGRWLSIALKEERRGGEKSLFVAHQPPSSVKN